MKNKEINKQLDYEIGSGNVFADLGMENAEEELFKSDMIAEVADVLRKKCLTQAQAAKILGVDQPRISSLLRGKLDLFSVEMLIHFLTLLGQDVEVRVTPKSPRSRYGHLSFIPISRRRTSISSLSSKRTVSSAICKTK